MSSKILIKLVDQAIIPALLLLTTRIVSMILLAQYLQVPFTISGSGLIFENKNTYVLLNSYSLFFMSLVLITGVLYVLLKSFVLHETHITPELTAKLFTLRLSSFVQTSFDLYSQGFVWLLYLFLLTAVVGVMFIVGAVYAWVFYVLLAASVFSAVLFLLDIENEFEYAKRTHHSADFDEYVWKLEI